MIAFYYLYNVHVQCDTGLLYFWMKGGKETCNNQATSKRAARFADGLWVLHSTTIALHSLSEIFIHIVFLQSTPSRTTDFKAPRLLSGNLTTLQQKIQLSQGHLAGGLCPCLQNNYDNETWHFLPSNCCIYKRVGWGNSLTNATNKQNFGSTLSHIYFFSVCYKCREIMRFLRGVQGCWELITRSYPAHSLNHRSHRSPWGPMTIWFT